MLIKILSKFGLPFLVKLVSSGLEKINGEVAQKATAALGDVSDAIAKQEITTKGIANIIPPTTPIPNKAGMVHIANCAVNSGTTYIECKTHQNMHIEYVALNGSALKKFFIKPSLELLDLIISLYAHAIDKRVTHHI